MAASKRSMLFVSAAMFVLSGPALATETTDAKSGQLLYNNACRTCHTLRENDHRLGPSLHNIIGKAAGSSDRYSFSASLADAGFVWDEKNLDAFIADPNKIVPGNNMKPYSGITDGEVRAKIIAFIKSRSRQ